MGRMSTTGIVVDPNLRCLRIYPTEKSDKSLRELKTVGIKLSREQAIDLARALLAGTQEWEEIEITAYRFKRRKRDGTYHITISSYVYKE